jgi:hypothetical protein
MKKYFSLLLFCLTLLPGKGLYAQNVWTQHNDQARTGWYPYETSLNTSNVNTNTFGISFKQTTDDKFLAQPLVVMKVNIPGVGIKNVVYVATLNNSVYAFDADVSTTAYWQKNFTNKLGVGTPDCTNCRPALSSDIHPSLCGGTYGDFKGNMGIISTPVIDTAAGTIFFVTKIVNQNDGTIDNHSYRSGIKDEYNYSTTGFHQYLHAVDITTGNERANSPVEITAAANGVGDGQTTPGRITFNPRTQFNRAGLVLSNGKIYISFAAHCDFNPSHGWVLSYNTSTLAQVNSYNATPNDGRGGIWMSGGAPAVDESGNLYVTTGNSLNEDRTSSDYNTFNALPSDPANRGEGVIKLAPDLTISSYFTPFNYIALNDADLDFPTQVLLVPNTNLAITGVKNGILYVMNKTGLGGFSGTQNNIIQTVSNGGSFHSSFAYFGGTATQYFYTFPENTPLKAYAVSGSGLGSVTTNNSMPSSSGSQGAYLSVSSNGNNTASAILWSYQAVNGCDANQSDCRGVLHAVSATNVTNELWNSEMLTADKISNFSKFQCPTVALGKVYIGANTNQLVVYALKSNATCLTNVAVGKTATALTSTSGFPASSAIDGTTSTKWTSTSHDIDSIYVDLGTTYDVCKIAINWDAAGYGKDFDLKTSLDGVNWTTVSSVRGNTALYNESNGTVTARYVNMRGITRGTANGYSITEFQIFGSPSNITCPAPTTLTATSTSVTSIFTNQIPISNTENDGQGMNGGLKFRSTVAGNVTGLRFYKTTGNTGTHSGGLYNSAGTLLGSVTFSGETATGWQNANFASPVAIAANQTYMAVYFNASGNYVEDNDYFTNSGITNGNLTALAEGVDGCNGPYDYGTSMLKPATCFKSANYWIDVLMANGSSPNAELINWDPIPGASQYLIQYRPNNSTSWIYRTSNTNSITLTALTCGIQYFYTVQAVCGGNQSGVSQSSFTTPNCTATGCDNLLTRFFSVDMGDIGVAGSTCRSGAVYTIKGSGTDIGGTGDQFQYVYTNANDTASYDVSARITGQTASNASSKVGVMVRDSLTNTSRFAYIAYMSNKFVFVYRSQPSASATTITVPGTFTLPYFVKISKSGTVYSAYISPDGNAWTAVGSQDLNFGKDPANTPHFGMAVTSADNSKLSTGIVDGFALVTGGTVSPVIANAGATQTITLPTSTVTLDGSVSTGNITAYAWTRISGPNTPTITSPASVTTTVTGLIAGTYVFQLSVNAGASLSQVTINVNPANTGGTGSIYTTQIPVATTDNDHQATIGQEVGLRFRSSAAGFITGIKFYKTAGNTGTHIGELYSNTGTRLGQATFTGETTTGWQTVTFSSPIAITANTTYVAAYWSSLGNYVEDNNYFLNTGVTNGNLTALKDGVDGCNAPYSYSSAATFPNACYLSANYWVDVIYSSGGTAPVVANAGANQAITLPASSVTLNGSGSTGTITAYAWTKISGPNTPVITTPTTVSTTVTGLIAGTYVFQLSVNAGASTSQVTVTVSAAGVSSTIFTTQIPAVGTDNDHQATVGQELGVKFTSSIAGFIAGIRFYKTSGNTGTHIGELYSSAGARLAQATFTGETATGWQTALFSSPVAITAGTTYTAAYFSSLGNYTEENNYFLGRSVTNSPLTAPADLTNGASGTDPGTGQGTYKYTGTPTFPDQLYLSANYWVDAIFSTTGSITAAPVTLSTATAVDNDSTASLKYFLGQNHPNPSVQVTRIDYSIPKDSKVELKLFDLTGRQIKVLLSEWKSSGTYYYDLNTADLAKGVYIYKMQSGNYTEVKRMIVQ